MTNSWSPGVSALNVSVVPRFLLIDATDNTISSHRYRIWFGISLYPFHFSRTLPLRLLKGIVNVIFSKKQGWIFFLSENLNPLQGSNVCTRIPTISANISPIPDKRYLYFLSRFWYILVYSSTIFLRSND